MRDPSLAVQKAVYQRLSTNTALSSFVSGRVFDEVPENSPFPFVNIGDDDFEPENYYTKCTVRINGLARAVGQVEAKTLAALIIDAMVEPLALTAPFVATAHRHLETNYGEDLEHGSQLAEVMFELIVQQDA